jgi:hypothetical protein
MNDRSSFNCTFHTTNCRLAFGAVGKAPPSPKRIRSRRKNPGFHPTALSSRQKPSPTFMREMGDKMAINKFSKALILPFWGQGMPYLHIHRAAGITGIGRYSISCSIHRAVCIEPLRLRQCSALGQIAHANGMKDGIGWHLTQPSSLHSAPQPETSATHAATKTSAPPILIWMCSESSGDVCTLCARCVHVMCTLCARCAFRTFKLLQCCSCLDDGVWKLATRAVLVGTTDLQP